tara:strand:+ start:3664 stop:4206 length:543 start_codon:yes stop_codon:yes gene_type:complete
MSNQQKQQTESIYKSLSAFQQECPVIHKGTKGYGYTYADLPTIFKVINPILKKYNLGITQPMTEGFIETRLFHITTGQTIISRTPIPTDVQLKGMNQYQVLGSAVTYIRRYALSSMLGIVTDKDTDAAGEQIPNKKRLSKERFQKGLDKIEQGEISKQEFLNMIIAYDLTEIQKKAIKLL